MLPQLLHFPLLSNPPFALVLYLQFVTHCNFSQFTPSQYFSLCLSWGPCDKVHMVWLVHCCNFWSPTGRIECRELWIICCWIKQCLENETTSSVTLIFPQLTSQLYFPLRPRSKVTILYNLWGPFQCHTVTNVVFTDLLNLLWNSVPDAWLTLEFVGLRTALLGAQMSSG